MSNKFIELQGISQSFKTAKGPFLALDNIDLRIAKGDFVALIGHSGCGKSTLLNLIAGLTTPTTGVLLCANREIQGPGPERAVVFQNHSLLPWLTCYENVQRVGIARALSMEPQVLLMDEPFGALDALTRAKLQDELLEIVARTRSTVVMVTHDVDEAVLLSDKIVMMTNGPAAHIGEILSVDIPRPRKRVELATDPEYLRCRQAVMDFLYTRQAHVEKAA